MVSCGDDEEDIDREPLIIGTWTLESQEISSITANGITVDPSSPLLGGLLDTLAILPENSEITFNQDHTYSAKAPQQTTDLAGTWTLSGDQSTITLSGIEAAEALLGSSSLDFVIQSISSTNFSMVTSVSEINIPNIPAIGTANVSGDYQLILKK